MNKFGNFVDNYIQTAKEGVKAIFYTVKFVCWVIWGLFLVVVLSPLWLIGKIKCHFISPPPPEPLTQFEEGISAFKELLNNYRIALYGK